MQSGESKSEPASECRYANDSPFDTSIAIFNNTEIDIFVPYTVLQRPGMLTTAEGKIAPLEDPACLSFCESAQSELLCTAQAPAPIALRIIPGGSCVRSWDGLYSVRHELPSTCSEEARSETCVQKTTAEPGMILRYEAHGSVNCEEPTCNCVPDADGCCRILGASATQAAEFEGRIELSTWSPGRIYEIEISRP